MPLRVRRRMGATGKAALEPRVSAQCALPGEPLQASASQTVLYGFDKRVNTRWAFA
jgi:hypothetical protein